MDGYLFQIKIKIMNDNQNRLPDLQNQIDTHKQKLALAEENYQTAKRSCRIADANQLKTQIEYLRQRISELESE